MEINWIKGPIPTPPPRREKRDESKDYAAMAVGVDGFMDDHVTSKGDAPQFPGRTTSVPRVEVPWQSREALRRLGAPAFLQAAGLMRWAEPGWKTSLLCHGLPGQPGIRHGVHLDYHTGASRVVADTRWEEDRIANHHFLVALGSGRPVPCEEFGITMAQWLKQGVPQPCAWGQSRVVEMRDVRTVLRTVQYVDAGFDPYEHRAWLAINATADHVRFVYDVAARTGLTVARMGSWLLRYVQGITFGASTSEELFEMFDTALSYGGLARARADRSRLVPGVGGRRSGGYVVMDAETPTRA